MVPATHPVKEEINIKTAMKQYIFDRVINSEFPRILTQSCYLSQSENMQLQFR
jgi:hypothetical protein